ncbi:hypothetical protein [Pseudarthrobacter albicanus]|uniref:hypothetical protein n=1 Tax=Pseudarthrobacter albicanus TaxID=2823873 RepID=UPI001BA4CA33|nr:hypothetical protein [Pseudarthrobacter albicanus]
MSSGLASAVQFAGSLPGSILLILGHALVLVCMCSDMIRLLSVPRSHRRYVATTVFRTLALPAIVIMAASVLIDVASGAWQNVATGVFILMTVTFRWRNDTDEDNWWKGQGKKLARWLRNQTASRSLAAPAAA